MNKISVENRFLAFSTETLLLHFILNSLNWSKYGVGTNRKIVTLPFRVHFLCTESQGIKQYHLQKFDNGIIDLDAALTCTQKIHMGWSSVFSWNFGLKPFHMLIHLLTFFKRALYIMSQMNFPL